MVPGRWNRLRQADRSPLKEEEQRDAYLDHAGVLTLFFKKPKQNLEEEEEEIYEDEDI